MRFYAIYARILMSKAISWGEMWWWWEAFYYFQFQVYNVVLMSTIAKTECCWALSVRFDGVGDNPNSL